MPQIGHNPSTDSSSPLQPHRSHCYQKACTSRWELQPLFQSFLEDRPAETVLAVRERRLLVSWDLKAIHYLRRCLKRWILDGIPGDAIGAFLVTILYEQDFHLDYRLTMMVRDEQSQVHIARRILAFYQIRDDMGEPIWDNLVIYPDLFDLHSPATHGMNDGSPEGSRLPLSNVPPADPRWPLFMGSLSEREFENLVHRLGDNQDVEEGLPPLFTGVSKEDHPIIEAFRRFTLHKNDVSKDLPVFKSSEKNGHTAKTNMAQDKSVSSSVQNLLALPPISRPSTSASSVRVSVFKAERNPEMECVDVATRKANVEQGKGKDQTNLNSSHPPGSKPRVDLNKPLPPIPAGLTCIPCYVMTGSETALPAPLLKRKPGVQDLRKAGERDA